MRTFNVVISHSNDSRNRPVPQRRGGGDTRRFRTAYRRACPFNGRLPAAVLPLAQARAPIVARHSRRFLTQNRAPGRFEGRKFWRPRGKHCFDIRQLVYSTYTSGSKQLRTVFRALVWRLTARDRRKMCGIRGPNDAQNRLTIRCAQWNGGRAAA